MELPMVSGASGLYEPDKVVIGIGRFGGLCLVGRDAEEV
jgi:hypothetical protein